MCYCTFHFTFIKMENILNILFQIVFPSSRNIQFITNIFPCFYPIHHVFFEVQVWEKICQHIFNIFVSSSISCHYITFLNFDFCFHVYFFLNWIFPDLYKLFFLSLYRFLISAQYSLVRFLAGVLTLNIEANLR